MEPTHRAIAADVTNEELDAMIAAAKQRILAREAAERERKASNYLRSKQEQSS